ncbi:MAG: hypothetical protein ABJD97_13930 [Betaproteobacteria bacterium]
MEPARPGARPAITMRLARHAPLRRCMYCLARGVPLSEEHLIPRALGGHLTLRDAVCEPCRVFTGRLEQATLEREFAVPKTLLALKRRRARGKGPTRLPPVALAGDGGSAAIALDADAYPRRFELPVFDEAGLLAGIDRAGAAPRIAFAPCHLRLGTPTRDHAAAPPALPDPHAYAIAVAKWAYAMDVAAHGLDGRDTSAIRDLLAGRRHDVFNFVGTAHPRRAAAREWLHGATTRDNGPWRTVVLDLLGSAGLPPYEVVVGPRA